MGKIIAIILALLFITGSAVQVWADVSVDVKSSDMSTAWNEGEAYRTMKM